MKKVYYVYDSATGKFVTIVNSPKELDSIRVNYKSPYTVPINVGSYSVTPIIYSGESAELVMAKMHLQVVEIIGIAFLILYIIAFISDKFNRK